MLLSTLDEEASVGTDDEDAFALDLRVVVDVSTVSDAAVPCGTDDGCAATCASSCVSNM